VAELLIAHGADIEASTHTNRTCLLAAVAGNHCSTFKMLVENGADVMKVDKSGISIWHEACSSGHLDMVHLLLSMCILPPIDGRVRDIIGRTPLVRI
jgi:ankyrin repeat protein